MLGDGGWEICEDVDVRPRQPCVIYSFGINNEFSFDDYSAKTYGCHVYSFDPSMKQASHNRSDHVHFYKWGLAGNTEKRSNGWQMYTLTDIRKQLGHLVIKPFIYLYIAISIGAKTIFLKICPFRIERETEELCLIISFIVLCLQHILL